MTSENNECDASRCHIPLNSEGWYFIVRKRGGEMEAVHTRCLEKIDDFDSTVDSERQENGSGEVSK
jgi:hypothetical protein